MFDLAATGPQGHGLVLNEEGSLIETQPLELSGPVSAAAERILTPEAMAFVAELVKRFESERVALLQHRMQRLTTLQNGQLPDFLPETEAVRREPWAVCPAPPDLRDRRVEITGPVDAKMMINALNSGAQVFMADFEDSCSPTWSNIVEGQAHLMDAVRGTLAHRSPDGKAYRLAEQVATLVVRPRGWHLTERHVTLDGVPVSASLFDFGLFFFHNAEALIAKGSGPYLYLPKLEGHLEARLWNDVFNFAQDALGVPRGSIRATVLIETVLAAFEMDEILFELKEHATGLNAGRWDYIFSLIKKLGHRPEFLLGDRARITMEVPFLRSYADLLVQSCHRRGAHAIGGMAAFIPSRRHPEINERAFARVREDKEREAGLGFDGTWVAHPDLVPVARDVFDRVLAGRCHQLERRREARQVRAAHLLEVRPEDQALTEAGFDNNVSVAMQYLSAWLGGTGAVAINDLMEDVATAEISRAQLWQWVRQGARLADGRPVDEAFYRARKEAEMARLSSEGVALRPEAIALLDDWVVAERFPEFLTLSAYPLLQP